MKTSWIILLFLPLMALANVIEPVSEVRHERDLNSKVSMQLKLWNTS
jgi:hypothetical protein